MIFGVSFNFGTVTAYSDFSTIKADMPVEPFLAFPEEFHIRRKTYMALIAYGIGHTHRKVLKIRFLV